MECFICKKDYNKLFGALVDGEFKDLCWFCLNRECVCGSFFFKKEGPDEICLECGRKLEEEEMAFNPS